MWREAGQPIDAVRPEGWVLMQKLERDVFQRGSIPNNESGLTLMNVFEFLPFPFGILHDCRINQPGFGTRSGRLIGNQLALTNEPGFLINPHHILMRRDQAHVAIKLDASLPALLGKVPDLSEESI